MRKIFVNGASLPADVRTLSPFAYKDTIKTLDKSNEARVTLDGVTVFRSAVTSGRDVKNAGGGLKFHLYFYLTREAAEARDTAKREFLPITGEEFRAYKEDPAYTINLVSANLPTAPVLETEVVVSAEPETEVVVPDAEPEVSETEVLPEEPTGNGSSTRRSRLK